MSQISDHLIRDLQRVQVPDKSASPALKVHKIKVMSADGIGANVFITGANRGIGLGLVKEIVKLHGVNNIFAGCREPSSAKDLKELEKSTHSIVKMVQIDVQDDQSIKAAFDEVSKSLGKNGALNLLINNSGIFKNKGVSVEKPDRSAFSETFDVNTIGAVMTTAAFLPLTCQAGTSNQPAKIVNISSMISSTFDIQSTKKITDGNIVYGMSKAALNHYTKALAGDVKEYNVMVIAICPGWVRTDMGGPEAALSVDESVFAIVKLIAGLKEDQSGAYLDRFGKPIAF
uniref:C-factor n=1 Tax=Ditylenchus dipsaci TaxID=166011 RepID=A0A915D0J8_9BILA